MDAHSISPLLDFVFITGDLCCPVFLFWSVHPRAGAGMWTTKITHFVSFSAFLEAHYGYICQPGEARDQNVKY